MSMGKMSWERDSEWFDEQTWFVEWKTGAHYPYANEVDREVGPWFRMFWEQPHEWRWYPGKK